MNANVTSARAIADRLALDPERVARYLLPNGKQEGADWCAEFDVGGALGSLRVRLVGGKTGQWEGPAATPKANPPQQPRDVVLSATSYWVWSGRRAASFVDDVQQRTDSSVHEEKKGDLLDLWCMVRGVPSEEGIREAKEWIARDLVDRLVFALRDLNEGEPIPRAWQRWITKALWPTKLGRKSKNADIELKMAIRMLEWRMEVGPNPPSGDTSKRAHELADEFSNADPTGKRTWTYVDVFEAEEKFRDEAIIVVGGRMINERHARLDAEEEKERSAQIRDIES